MIDNDHPAVKAMLWYEGQYNYGEPPENWHADLRKVLAADYTDKLEHALPHLESATPENIERLRNTPVGRALMSEAWDVCADEGHACGWLHEFAREDIERRNPYEEDSP